MTPARDAAAPAETGIPARSPEEQVTLLEMLDRLLDKGVVLSGDVTLAVADVDLVYVGLRVLLSSAETAQRLRLDTGPASGSGDSSSGASVSATGPAAPQRLGGLK